MQVIIITYDEFINNILDTRGRFACGDKYHERHHIVPRCMNGSDDKENLIDLYAREHFIAHKLLAQENPEVYNLVYAWGCMAWEENSHQERRCITPEEYEEAKIVYSKLMSIAAKERLAKPENNPMYGVRRFGEDNPMYGKHHTKEVRKILSEKGKARYSEKKDHPWYGRHHTEESKIKMSKSHKKRLENPENHPMYGKHHTKESRKKMGENHIKMLGKDNPRSRTIEQYTLSGDFIKVFDSVGEASRATGIDGSSISRCANGKLKSAGGFDWKYVD